MKIIDKKEKPNDLIKELTYQWGFLWIVNKTGAGALKGNVCSLEQLISYQKFLQMIKIL